MEIVFIISYMYCIEGNPFITRFKTQEYDINKQVRSVCIEGNPFITRFKT